MPEENTTFKVEDAQLLFRNFSGEARRFNNEGNRNFCVVLDQEAASEMAADGWRIKHLKAREEGDEDTPYIKVTVKYKFKPPKIHLLTSTSRTLLSEELVGTLDWMDIDKCDLIARAVPWEMNDDKGISAYLQTMFVTMREDELEAKYAALLGGDIHG